MSWLILLIGLIAYYTSGRRFQSSILVILSLVVYWLVGRWSILPIVSLAILFTLFGMLLQKHHSKGLLITPICLNVMLFIACRESFTGLALPIGVSVLSFTGISYLVDQYRSQRCYNPIDVLSYLLFFPKIFAGPIERASNFIGQSSKQLMWKNIYIGFKYLVYASFLKFVISNLIAHTTFETAGMNLFIAMMTYSISFFFDFWAYTLMAIGVGYVFGYKLTVSFDRPYYSISFRDFWHRWNITLGLWLRDYIYIPLGGNRLSKIKWVGAVLLVFLVSGLWHGSTLPFILWGMIHGLLLCIEKLYLNPDRLRPWLKYIYSTIVFVCVSMLWQLFIVDSSEILTRYSEFFHCDNIQWSSVCQLTVCVLSVIIFTNNRVFNLVSGDDKSRNGILAEVTMLSLMLTTMAVLNCPISFDYFYFRF